MPTTRLPYAWMRRFIAVLLNPAIRVKTGRCSNMRLCMGGTGAAGNGPGAL
jgi:hypothetical protein